MRLKLQYFFTKVVVTVALFKGSVPNLSLVWNAPGTCDGVLPARSDLAPSMAMRSYRVPIWARIQRHDSSTTIAQCGFTRRS